MKYGTASKETGTKVSRTIRKIAINQGAYMPISKRFLTPNGLGTHHKVVKADFNGESFKLQT